MKNVLKQAEKDNRVDGTDGTQNDGRRVDVDRLVVHIRALRDEVERLRDEIDKSEAHLLSVGETAMRLNLSERTVRSFVSDGSIHSVKIGRRRLIPRDAVDEFIRSRVEADTPT